MTDSEDHLTVAKVTSLDTPSTLNSSKEKSRGFFLTRRGDRHRKQTNLRKLVVGCLAPPQSSPAGAENGGGRAPCHAGLACLWPTDGRRPAALSLPGEGERHQI